MTDEEAPRGPRSDPGFAHASEAEFGRILDFYEVAWEYEPHVFPILWDLDGNVLESFAPDFFLPELELFVELTTLQQRLVRKKNRKVRRLRELYPGLRIKLFYARDFRALMLKYGRAALVSELSGALGQVTPHEYADEASADEASADEAAVAGLHTTSGSQGHLLLDRAAAGANTAGESSLTPARRSRAARRRAGRRSAAAAALQSPVT
jgi:hypothetical protein